MNAKILIAGASGMIGGLILDQCLESEEVGEVVSLVRKPSTQGHPKLTEVVVPDFTDYTELQQYFKDVKAAFFCVGVYTGTVPDDEFKKITVDYAVAFAVALYHNSPDVNLCFLSGAGADRDGKSRMSFARYKGMAENSILELGLREVHFFRPGYIYPVTKRKEPNMMYRFMRMLYPVLKPFFKSTSVASTDLARAMYITAMSGNQPETLENKDILAVVA